MGDTTGISWCDHTFNIWWGCVEVGNSPACQNCYAKTWANRMGFKVWGNDAERRYFGEKHFHDLFTWDARARKAGVRRRVFVMSMGDWAEGRPEQKPMLETFYRIVPQCANLDFLMLTKRPQLIRSLIPAEWLKDPLPNVWMGTTTDTQAWLENRWNHLKKIPAAVHWFSMEPIFSPMTLPKDFLERGDRAWAITGGESGAGARPMHPGIPRGLRDQCVAAGVPYHFKQWGEYGPMSSVKGLDPFPKSSLVVRPNGEIHTGFGMPEGAVWMHRVGKKAAGHLLDGREWQEFPLNQIGERSPVESFAVLL